MVVWKVAKRGKVFLCAYTLFDISGISVNLTCYTEMDVKCSVLRQLFEIGGMKFGQFTMKTGETTPVYADLRVMVSQPEIINSLAELVWNVKKKENLECDVLCGVPYTALPVATAIAVKNNFPMVLKRKEAKTYGTKNILEGKFDIGMKCLVIEDVVTSGTSVLETVEVLRKEGLVVTDCVVILNREQGGSENLEKHGLSLHSLFTLNGMVEDMQQQNLISDSTLQNVKEYLEKNSYIATKTKNPKTLVPFSQRAEMFANPVAKKLLTIIEKKETNLCVAVDVLKSCDLLKLADELGPYICMLKTHIDIIEDFSDSLIVQLRDIADKYSFLLMEDRKFCDIGNTVALQYSGGPLKIKEWADIVTVHSVPGEGVLLALKESASQDRACVLVAEMSSAGALTDEKYRNCTLKMAETHKEFVIGFVSQSRFAGHDFLYMCPGVNIGDKGDSLGQQYRSPEQVVGKNLIDIIIVGRGITKAQNSTEAARMYKERAYAVYKEMLQ